LYLNGTRVKSIIDTGSNISFISEELAIKSNLIIRRFPNPTTIQGLGDSGASVIGECINLRITISGETTYFSSIKVVDSSQVPMLLGMDWLIPAQIVLDLKNVKLKEYLNGKETDLIGIGRNILPMVNLITEPLFNKPIYLS
jgi:hypothetical protein